ncbi:hypothetical protein DICPUDRAFT_147411 [Dictyostelium purpureum]|uniref:Polyhydroxybutyrate depolymerase n=1 Tax=Dictyostelium purpureum TaxID=5786 RepID=F0Z8L8_DICPU|nr:uncharacterized protein DICPUDRAFT_147411 [Dictyostelium purpureum]EGC39750.1 hypothetical protein DICPUDRAFT_147411 [Dictyostelium purpureum]|eukprot:XP_003283736.1 hypothetical protein DICPUDRAFT_147411 [Dictyostelium purpureum]
MKKNFIYFVILLFSCCILPILSIDNQITVSGISSGGFFAVQYHIAFSSLVRGAAVLAGGPYWCAKGNAITAQIDCMKTPELISVDELIIATKYAQDTLTIDDTANLQNSVIWLYSGMNDTVVHPGVMHKLVEYYQNFLKNDSIHTVFNIQSEHAFITNGYGNNCTFLGPQYINNCDYNSPFEFLSLFYPNLQDPVNASPDNIITIDQSSFIPIGFTTLTASLNSEAFAYIPTKCKNDKSLCTIHVAFHGCLQTIANIGDSFYTKTGYNEIAEANNIIILYPQSMMSVLNPKGCFDWWGFAGENYATKYGAQMATVNSMVMSLLN